MTDPMIVVMDVQVTSDVTLSVVTVVIEIASLSRIVEEVSFWEGVAGDTLSIVVTVEVVGDTLSVVVMVEVVGDTLSVVVMVETFVGVGTMSINDLVLVTLSLVVSSVGDCVTIAVFMIVSFLHTHMACRLCLPAC